MNENFSSFMFKPLELVELFHRHRAILWGYILKLLGNIAMPAPTSKKQTFQMKIHSKQVVKFWCEIVGINQI